MYKDKKLPFWHLFFCGGFPTNKKYKLCRGPSNQHYYQVWFQLANVVVS